MDRKTLSVSESSIASDIHQSLDVESDLCAEVSFDVVLLFDNLSQKSDLILIESVDPYVWINICFLTDI